MISVELELLKLKGELSDLETVLEILESEKTSAKYKNQIEDRISEIKNLINAGESFLRAFIPISN